MTHSSLTHRFAMVEGHRIACLDEGEGPPLVLLHGIPTSSLLWREVIPELAKSRRVIAPDMLNYGKSDKPARADVSIAAQARILRGLLDALGLARVDLVAHDIGGGVAQILAVRHPERINRLILISAVCFDSRPIPEFDPLQEPGTEAGMSVAAFEAMLRDFLPQGVASEEGLSAEAMEIMLRPWAGEDGKAALFRNFRRLNPEYTMAIARELETLDLSVLVFWGDKDPFQKPAYAQRLADTIPCARLDWIKDTGHWIMEEQPGEVAARIAGFLDATATDG
jgi:pimeloyl-ACP methyl ester carboxylesterase